MMERFWKATRYAGYVAAMVIVLLVIPSMVPEQAMLYFAAAMVLVGLGAALLAAAGWLDRLFRGER